MILCICLSENEKRDGHRAPSTDHKRVRPHHIHPRTKLSALPAKIIIPQLTRPIRRAHKNHVHSSFLWWKVAVLGLPIWLLFESWAITNPAASRPNSPMMPTIQFIRWTGKGIMQSSLRLLCPYTRRFVQAHKTFIDMKFTMGKFMSLIQYLLPFTILQAHE